MSLSQEFIEYAFNQKVLRFGEFKTKAGRLSPYFFDAGLFNQGSSLIKLGEFYAKVIIQADIKFDTLLGAAYKGIPLVTTTTMALAKNGIDVPFCFNRKEIKDHGEGGKLVGAPLKGRVLLIDDVISAGTSVREMVELIRSNNAELCGLIIALDRMERGIKELSASQEVAQLYRIPVISIADLKDILDFLQTRTDMTQLLLEVRKYHQQYGATNNV